MTLPSGGRQILCLFAFLNQAKSPKGKRYRGSNFTLFLVPKEETSHFAPLGKGERLSEANHIFDERSEYPKRSYLLPYSSKGKGVKDMVCFASRPLGGKLVNWFSIRKSFTKYVTDYKGREYTSPEGGGVASSS